LASRRVALLSALLVAPAVAADHSDWFTLSADGIRTGYAHDEQLTKGDAITQRETITLFVRQLGRSSRAEYRVEFRSSVDDGRPLSFAYEYSAGTVNVGWAGTFANGSLRIRAAHGDPPRTLELPADTLFTPDRSARFAALWKKQEAELNALGFDPMRRSAGRLHAKVVADATDDVHVRVNSGPSLNATEENIWFAHDGAIQRIETNAFGARIVWTPCARDCDARVAQPMDAMAHLVVRSPVRIPPRFLHRQIRYVITRNDSIPPELAHTAEQAVVVEGARAIVSVCADCGNAEHPTETELAHYLAPNAWVRSDDAEIRHLALSTVARSASADLRMRKLTELVWHRMRGNNDFLGYADAVSALHTGSGDCTEFAVLLAALARAQGIPARIASGLAYSSRFSGKKDVFSPHMWVQAWNGTRWKSYDAALAGFDATHIALAIGNGEPDDVSRLMAQLPQLRIENAGVVRDDP
jgi:hypothetical protein